MSQVVDQRYLVASEEELRGLYEHPREVVLRKSLSRLDSHSKQFIAHSPFLVLASSNGSGMDASPRGGEPGFVDVLDDTHLLIADQVGNNRLDTMVNLLACPSVGILFLIPGIKETLRVNGTAVVTRDPGLLGKHELRRRVPKTGVIIEVQEAFLHCANSLSRSGLWNVDSWPRERVIPPANVIFREQTKMEVDF